jgi:putative spermidine/putrescine transport system permease protein
MKLGRRTALLVAILPLATFVFYLVAPLITSASMSLNQFGRFTGIRPDTSFAQYREILTSEFYRDIWLNTLRITIEAAALTVLVGAAAAYGIWRCGPRLRGYLTALVLAPLLVSGVVRAYGWIAVGGPRGPWDTVTSAVGLDGVRILFNEASVIIGFVNVFVAFVVILVLVRLDSVAPSVIRAAHDLGARNLSVIRRVLLPIAYPALFSGFLLVFALATAAYSIPVILGGGRVVMVAQLIYTEQVATFNWPKAAAMGLTLTVLTVLVMLGYQRIAGGRRQSTVGQVAG